MENYDALMSHLNLRLQFIEALNNEPLDGYSKSIRECQTALDTLKKHKIADGDYDEDKEITFYKKVKVPILSKLLYFVKMYNIEVRRPYGVHKTLIRYYKKEMMKLQKYLDENHQFYRYYRSGSTHLDAIYFTQNSTNLECYPESVLFYTETDFSTSHDAILATIMAYENILFDLQSEVESIERNKSGQNKARAKKMQWQANKNDLVELIYALHASGAVGPNTISLKNLTDAFGELFNVELGNVSRTFLELIERSQPTKFMDALKCNLQSKMQKVDEKKVK